ncbi:hypothetical protein EAL2_c21000 [Peptoclostridium acidaminophilum DSM 3953]|uniref:Uncharacterized protein n=1 Tax=Peptoclostridium acidaminophilum DSM 3953 TaxID=1286171 RepID=W8U949_PEPAC|nr:hypothetical protein EAL2_c21000 [Peptoclostridium acidaminophilum DSM 3953]
MKLKTDFFVEHSGKQISKKDMVRLVKDEWLQQGRLVKEIKDLQMYFNVDESKCYWVINNEDKGCIKL